MAFTFFRYLDASEKFMKKIKPLLPIRAYPKSPASLNIVIRK
jgi:hypothetical protein